MNIKNEKSCRACGQPILQQAKRCPHCHSWQSRAYTAFFHPAFSLLAVAFFIFFMGSMLYDVLDKGEAFFDHQDNILVVDSKIHFGKDGQYSYISCIGRVQNNTAVTWENPHFEVQYFNESGDLIDTISDENYDLILPAHSEATFRVRGQADKTADQYVKHKVSIKWARDASR